MKKIVASVLVGGGCSYGAAVWMINDPASFRAALLAVFVGCAVVCFMYSVYLAFEAFELCDK